MSHKNIAQKQTSRAGHHPASRLLSRANSWKAYAEQSTSDGIYIYVAYSTKRICLGGIYGCGVCQFVCVA